MGTNRKPVSAESEGPTAVPLMEKVQTRITKVAHSRLKIRCDELASREAFPVPYGRVINQLIMEHLPPGPAETAAPRRRLEKTA